MIAEVLEFILGLHNRPDTKSKFSRKANQSFELFFKTQEHVKGCHYRHFGMLVVCLRSRRGSSLSEGNQKQRAQNNREALERRSHHVTAENNLTYPASP